MNSESEARSLHLNLSTYYAIRRSSPIDWHLIWPLQPSWYSYIVTAGIGASTYQVANVVDDHDPFIAG